MRNNLATRCGALLLVALATAGAADDSRSLADHWAALKDVKTLEARFQCEKQLAALDTPLESAGRVWIRKQGPNTPGAVRFSTEKPYVSELILTDGKVCARSQHEEKWTETNQSSRPGLTAVMGQLGGWSTGDGDKLDTLYAVHHTQGTVPQPPATASATSQPAEPLDLYTLDPTNPDLLKAIKSLTLGIDPHSHALRYIEIRTQQEDLTRYWFSNVHTNVPLPADVFKAGSALVMPPEGHQP